ncbi:PH domain-containing protein [Herbidospora galbida]|uniref:PH domain-containing protein n=1 Tax=Herbidospora galbida TaxID=2575442 RepID=A0A4U3LTF8_9ACTN|nr:PH domain-containing protein [Herbidospora galbida]TKK79062.1 PH domain-containing protein [Herbidospora galbida]
MSQSRTELRPPEQRVERRSVTWWTLRAVIGGGLLTGLLAYLTATLPDARPWLGPLLAAAAVVSLVYVGVMPAVRYRVHRWETTGEAVYALSGWVVREWRVAPISRIQTVDTKRGPLQQLLRLATVTVTTGSAHGPVRITGLDQDVAARVARDLTEITRRTPGDAT